MKQFLTLNDLQNFDAQVALAKEIKANQTTPTQSNQNKPNQKQVKPT